MKDIQRYDAHHDPITLNYMAAGCTYPCDFNVYILIMCSVTKTLGTDSPISYSNIFIIKFHIVRALIR